MLQRPQDLRADGGVHRADGRGRSRCRLDDEPSGRRHRAPFQLLRLRRRLQSGVVLLRPEQAGSAEKGWGREETLCLHRPDALPRLGRAGRRLNHPRPGIGHGRPRDPAPRARCGWGRFPRDLVDPVPPSKALSPGSPPGSAAGFLILIRSVRRLRLRARCALRPRRSRSRSLPEDPAEHECRWRASARAWRARAPA